MADHRAPAKLGDLSELEEHRKEDASGLMSVAIPKGTPNQAL
jgi:hypothetical protein